MIETTASPVAQISGSLGRLSVFMCFAIVLTAVAMELYVIWIWLDPDIVRELVLDMIAFDNLPVDTSWPARLAGFAIYNIQMLVLFYILYQAFRLFHSYRSGDIVQAEAPLRLRRIGFGILVLAVLRRLALTLLVLALTGFNPPGQRILWFGFTFDDFVLAIFGGLLIAIAHVMVEATRAAHENRSFV